MAKDELTYSEAVRAAAAKAAAALGTNPEAVRQRPTEARPRAGNDGKARVLLDVDPQKDKAASHKRRDVQPSAAASLTNLLNNSGGSRVARSIHSTLRRTV
jgi:hypothetical protein